MQHDAENGSACICQDGASGAIPLNSLSTQLESTQRLVKIAGHGIPRKGKTTLFIKRHEMPMYGDTAVQT